MKITILDYLEDVEKKYPQKIAYSELKNEYTFKQITYLSKVIGSNIIKMGKEKTPIMIYMRKSIKCIAAFFGTLYAGGVYCPIDVEMPIERVSHIYNVLNPQVIICDDDLVEQAKRKWGDTCICITIDELLCGFLDIVSIEKVKKEICSLDLMYVLFTSGSTGMPKGVAISHKAAVDFAEWISEKYGFAYSDSLCNQAPLYFDASIPDVLIPAVSGATAYFPPKMYYSFPKKVLAYVEEKKITTLIWVPSALRTVIDCHAFETCVPNSVKRIIFCGEVFPSKYLKEWKKFIPDALYVNMYGPTETTYACTYYDIHGDFDVNENIPLGKACENCKIILLDEKDEETKPNVVGEICVVGDCLSSGYYNDDEKTNNSFGRNPLNKNWYERMYRTGDLAYRDENNILHFVGRKDFQIKKMGYRIELGEIETIINAHEKISNACCLYDPETQKIILLYKGEIGETELKSYIDNSLLQYMRPDKLIKLDQIPLNPNGKIDRVYLKKEYMR